MRLSRRTLLAALLPVLLVSALGLQTSGRETSGPAPAVSSFTFQSGGLQYVLPSLNGGWVRSDARQGQVELVYVWATWSPPSVEQLAVLEQWWRKYRDRGLMLTAMALDNEPELAAQWMRQQGYTFPCLALPQALLAGGEQVGGAPTLFVLDHDSRILRKQEGLFHAERLHNELTALLGDPGSSPSQASRAPAAGQP